MYPTEVKVKSVKSFKIKSQGIEYKKGNINYKRK